MAITFGDVAGQEPSTVSFRVETAVINRNGTNVNREILVFGDPESSLGVGRVLAADPASTEYGVVVRQVGYSTIASISTGSIRVHQSTAADLNVTVAGYSTVVSVSTGSVRVHQSSAADLNVTVAGYSTVASISTGSVRVHQSSAADLNVTVAGYSTTVNVSSLGGAVIVRSSAADALVTAYQSTYTAFNGLMRLADRDASTNVANITNTDPASTAYGLVVRTVGGGSTVVTVSTGSVRVHQSTAADLNVTVAGYSTIATISTGSVRVHQSTAADLNVTVAGYSTIATVSTGSVRVHQSTAADLQATVAQASTTWQTQTILQASTQLVGRVGLMHEYGAKTTITITSTGLTNGSARESNFVENGTLRYRDYHIHLQRKGTTASSGLVDFYVYESLGDTSYSDFATGADAAFTSTNRRQSRYLGSLQMSTAPAVVRGHFKLSDIFETMPQRWGLIEINNSAGTLSSTSTDLVAEYTGVY